MDRKATLLWMKDLLEHLNYSHEQWYQADHRTDGFLSESMRRDLDELRRLCESLGRSTSGEMRGRQVAA